MDRGSIADERERLADAREDDADAREAAAVVDGPARGTPVEPPVMIGEVYVTDLGEAVAALDDNAARRELQDDRADLAVDVPGAPATDAWAVERREFVADDRQEQADARQVLADERDDLLAAAETARHDDDAATPGVAAPGAVETGARAREATERAGAEVVRARADRLRASAPGAQPLAAEFLSIGRALLTADTPDEAMAQVVDAAVRFVNGCDVASFSALVGDVVTTIASTGPVADSLDDAQYRTTEGPCLQAIRTLQVVISHDLARDERWPAFVAAAGVTAGSALSAPVLEAEDDGVRASPFGALNSYGEAADAFDERDVETAVLLTAHLGALLLLANASRESTAKVVQLAEAVATRDVIGQAKGILMERGNLTAGQAFDVLRTASQRLNRKVRDVAEELAEQGEIATEPRRAVSPSTRPALRPPLRQPPSS